jgi:hypothetical protein
MFIFQSRNCADEGMLCFFFVDLIFLLMTLFWLFVALIELVGL